MTIQEWMELRKGDEVSYEGKERLAVIATVGDGQLRQVVAIGPMDSPGLQFMDMRGGTFQALGRKGEIIEADTAAPGTKLANGRVVAAVIGTTPEEGNEFAILSVQFHADQCHLVPATWAKKIERAEGKVSQSSADSAE